MTSFRMTTAKAECKECGYKVSQIDFDREHARQVVLDAMNRHIEEQHPTKAGK